MIDLYGIADSVLGIVNKPTQIIVKCSDGFDIAPDGTPVRRFFTLEITADVQALSSQDLEHIANINQQADNRVVYVRGGLKGLSRPLQVGGDVLNFYGSDWLVTQPVEEWGNGEWCKVIVTRQTGEACQT